MKTPSAPSAPSAQSALPAADTSSQRFIAAAPAGVLPSLEQEAGSLTRGVFELLLRAGGAVHLRLPTLSAELRADPREVARALFALVRESRIVVADRAQQSSASGWKATGMHGLDDDLVTLARPGQKLVLATDDGLCMARCGWSPYEAEVMAAIRPRDFTPERGEMRLLRVGARRFRLCASAPINTSSPALLRLGHRLLSLPEAALAQEMPC